MNFEPAVPFSNILQIRANGHIHINTNTAASSFQDYRIVDYDKNKRKTWKQEYAKNKRKKKRKTMKKGFAKVGAEELE